MPSQRDMPLKDLDILTILMAHVWIDLRLGGEVGSVWATLDVQHVMNGPWTRIADIQDAVTAPDALLAVAALAEAWAMADGWGREREGEEPLEPEA